MACSRVNFVIYILVHNSDWVSHLQGNSDAKECVQTNKHVVVVVEYVTDTSARPCSKVTVYIYIYIYLDVMMMIISLFKNIKTYKKGHLVVTSSI